MEIVCVGINESYFSNLKRSGIDFKFVESQLDFDSLSAKDSSLSLEAAQKMAESQLQKNSEALIIGYDQTVILEGEVQKKPQTVERATKQVFKLAAKQHEVVCSSYVIHGDYKNSSTSTSQISMRDFSLMESFAYAAFDEPADTAAGYDLQKAGMCLIDKITSENCLSLYGVPVNFVVDCMLARSIDLPCFQQ